MNRVDRMYRRTTVTTIVLAAVCFLAGALLGHLQSLEQIDDLTIQVIELQHENIELTYMVDELSR